MTFTVRQHLPSGLSRVVLTTDDEGGFVGGADIEPCDIGIAFREELFLN